MNFKRKLAKKIQQSLFTGKVIILYGPRQVGKTTLVRELIEQQPTKRSAYFDCEEPDIKAALTGKTSTELKAFLGEHDLVILDEAQRVKDIGITLKLLVDHYPEMQIVATGSSSFELSNKVVEPLTGRMLEFHLYPIAYSEFIDHSGQLAARRSLERHLIYGMYPEVLRHDGAAAAHTIKQLARSYIYKDIFVFQDIRNPEPFEKLVQALALQIGNEVSYTELAQLVGIDKNTVQQYIRLLEQAFIIFRLPPFSRNIRNELKKLRKIYFYDTGLRNAVINNFNALDLRTDTGALWENYVLSERIKKHAYSGQEPLRYFWRTHNQQEIDYIEESNGNITGYEIKWKPQQYRAPKVFVETYANSTVELITPENFESFIA